MHHRWCTRQVQRRATRSQAGRQDAAAQATARSSCMRCEPVGPLAVPPAVAEMPREPSVVTPRLWPHRSHPADTTYAPSPASRYVHLGDLVIAAPSEFYSHAEHSETYLNGAIPAAGSCPERVAAPWFDLEDVTYPYGKPRHLERFERSPRGHRPDMRISGAAPAVPCGP